MPKPQPYDFWPVKLIDGQYYILDVEAFEFPSFCIILEREGKEPEILPAKTLEEAEILLLPESSAYRLGKESIPYKLYESKNTPFRLLSIENQDAIRWGLNNYQVYQMKRKTIKYLSYSILSPLQVSPQNDYLCFPYGEHKQVRANFHVQGQDANFHVQGQDLKEPLMKIEGFEEILSLSFFSAMERQMPSLEVLPPIATGYLKRLSGACRSALLNKDICLLYFIHFSPGYF